MRAYVLIGTVVAGVGCFDPQIPTGAPCDPAAPSCPHDQLCVPGPAGYTCELAGDGDASLGPTPDAPLGSDPDAPIDVTPDGPTTSSPDAPPVHAEYVATVAECIDPMMPSPAFCKSINGADQMVVDHRDTGTTDPWNAYVRFEVDAAIAGRTVTSVVLRLTATDDPKAPGANAGDVSLVSPFDAASLAVATPIASGTAVAPSPGPVDIGSTIDWQLPTDAVAASSPLYLGITSSSTDGVNYWNLAGPVPPRLIIDAQ